MTRQFSITSISCAIVAGLIAAAPVTARAQDASARLSMVAARVSIAGTANLYEFKASTTDVQLTRIAVARGVPTGPALLAAIVNPGALEALEVIVPAGTLTSSQHGLDQDMREALKVAQYPDIAFRLVSLEAKPAGEGDALSAIGMLTIAGVEREVRFDLRAAANASTVTVIADIPLLMTDYGITPPSAMLGLLKTDPQVTVSFEVVLAAPQTFTR